MRAPRDRCPPVTPSRSPSRLSIGGGGTDCRSGLDGTDRSAQRDDLRTAPVPDSNPVTGTDSTRPATGCEELGASAGCLRQCEVGGDRALGNTKLCRPLRMRGSTLGLQDTLHVFRWTAHVRCLNRPASSVEYPLLFRSTLLLPTCIAFSLGEEHESTSLARQARHPMRYSS